MRSRVGSLPAPDLARQGVCKSAIYSHNWRGLVCQQVVQIGEPGGQQAVSQAGQSYREGRCVKIPDLFFITKSSCLAFGSPASTESSPFSCTPRACTTPQRGVNRRTDPQQAFKTSRSTAISSDNREFQISAQPGRPRGVRQRAAAVSAPRSSGTRTREA